MDITILLVASQYATGEQSLNSRDLRRTLYVIEAPHGRIMKYRTDVLGYEEQDKL